MKYTVERRGENWIASNGTDTVEGESPDDALYKILYGETEREDGSGDFDAGVRTYSRSEAADWIGRHCVTLLRLTAGPDVPEVIVRNEIDVLTKWVERWIVT